MGIRRRSGRSRRQAHRKYAPATGVLPRGKIDFEAECLALVAATRTLLTPGPPPDLDPDAYAPRDSITITPLDESEVVRLRDQQFRLQEQVELMHQEAKLATDRNTELEQRLAATQAKVNASLDELKGLHDEQQVQAQQVTVTVEDSTRRENELRREIDLLKHAYSEMADINAEHEAMTETYRETMSRRSREIDTLRQEVADRDSELERLRRAMASREVEAAEHAENLRIALLESEAHRAAEAEEFVTLLAERSIQDQTRT